MSNNEIYQPPIPFRAEITSVLKQFPFIYEAECVYLVTSAVMWDDYCIQSKHTSEAGFGQTEQRWRIRGTQKCWPAGDSCRIFGKFRMSLRTAAGSSDTWGYTWRRNNADCEHQGYNRHWVFKISDSASERSCPLTNTADASFLCCILWTTETTCSYDRLYHSCCYPFSLRHPSFVFFFFLVCLRVLNTFSCYRFFGSRFLKFVRMFFFVLFPRTPHTRMIITAHKTACPCACKPCLTYLLHGAESFLRS